MLLFFPKTKEDKEFSLEFFGKVSRNVESRDASGEIFESDVLDGAFSTLVKQHSCLLAAATAQGLGKRRKRKSKRCEMGAVLCQPRERVYDSCSLFS